MPDASRRSYRIRVALWSCILAGVLLYAARDYSARQTRRSWQRPLQVALVLLRRAELDPEALTRLTLRLPELELALEREFVRHGGGFRPFRFHKFGPVLQERPVPVPADDPSFFDQLRLSLALRQFASESDELVQLPDLTFDGCIYVLLSPPASEAQALAEGLGEDGGRLAITSLELSEDSVDFGLFVVTHELFHLLGAGDRYASDGTAQLPEGLGEPELVPLYPQRTVEVMTRGRVITPGEEVPPSELDELRVGTTTAREIGWLR